VVAIAGSQDKVNYLTKELHADVGINYKDHPTAKDMKEALQKACPNGIDIYFDNVGGYTTDAVLELINVRVTDLLDSVEDTIGDSIGIL
jgi:NADPH-dependent curcumin reductase CurA